MNWFAKLCRDLGLMVHNIKHPEDKKHRVIHKEVEEEKQDKVILRRTTIEEVEIRKEPNKP